MENKPIVTCCGDQKLVAKLHTFFKQGLPREQVEWRRSYGRPVRNIRVDANFVPYQKDLVPNEDNWILLGRSFFHIYFTDCDIDTYKSTVKDEINEWLSGLKSKGVSDWLIVIVVNDENKVKTKILRTSVMDKVKNDFCNKQQDRCAVLQEPFKPDSKSSESWSKLFVLLRQHILQSFNNNLNKFEEHMRLQREKRQEVGWTFNQYFLLQEELAFMFEMLGLYDDALIQYDELDALFTQFVLNHAAGDTAEWIHNYQVNVPSRWDSIQLSTPIDFSKRTLIRSCKDSVLDLRNYLFLRQATLLFLLLKPWEVAERAVPFMYNCLQELDILQLKLPPGGAACWVFLTCLEIVKTCESSTNAGKMETYSLHMAVLWDYARKKLYELGGHCGLLPGMQTVSEHLTLVVDLISGFTQPQDTDALIKLREALSSKTSFTKHYLELSELAMGTYKHIGRMRSAKLICKDLAQFYIDLEDYQKAESFLLDALKVYVQEGWTVLTDDIRTSLAMCQKQLESQDKYIRTCVHLCASRTLSEEKRKYYWQQVLDTSPLLQGASLHIPTKPLILVPELQPQSSSFLVTETSLVNVSVFLSSAVPVICNKIAASLAFHSTEFAISLTEGPGLRKHKRNPSVGSFSSIASGGSNSIDVVFSNGTDGGVGRPVDIPPSKIPQAIDLQGHFEYSGNRKLVLSSGLKSRMSLRRVESNSHKVLMDREVEMGDYGLCMESSEGPVVLQPGHNEVTLQAKLEEPGLYTITQLCFTVGNVELLRNIPVEEVTFHVLCHQPQLNIACDDDSIFGGVYQKFTVQVDGGTLGVNRQSEVCVKSSEGLTVKADQLKNGCFEMTPLEPGESKDLTVHVMADICVDKTEPSQHKLNVEWKSLNLNYEKSLAFKQPIKIHHQLHTAGKRKFIQCLVQSVSDLPFDLANPRMTCECKDVDLVTLNKVNKTLVINQRQNATYMWELKTNVPDEEPGLNCVFRVDYKHSAPEYLETEKQTCTYSFTLQSYKTVYRVESTVSPVHDTQVCTVNTPCHFTFHVKRLTNNDDHGHLVYDITCDKNTWKCTGQTQGLIQLDSDEVFTHQVSVCPQTEGYLPHPQVNLYTTKPSWNSAIETNTKEGVTLDTDDLTDQGILIAMATGQVYCSTVAQRLHVVTHSDVVLGKQLSGDVISSHIPSSATLQVVDKGPL